MALGGAGAAQAQSASSGPSMPNATTIIQQFQSGKFQNQNFFSNLIQRALAEHSRKLFELSIQKQLNTCKKKSRQKRDLHIFDWN
jgi:hypothetical protein